MKEELQTIRDYLKTAVNDIIQDKERDFLSNKPKFNEIDFNVGKRRLRIASSLLEKGYPVDARPHEVINLWGGLDKVPNYGELDIESDKGLPWMKENKKKMCFIKGWDDKSKIVDIDYLPVIPSSGDILDLGTLLWTQDELKNRYIPGCDESLYYVTNLIIGENNVRVNIIKYAEYIKLTVDKRKG